MFDFYKYRCDISTNDALKCFRSPSIFPLKIYFQDLSSWQYQVLLLAAFFASCSGWSLQWVLFFLHQHNLNHHYHFCNNDDNDDDQGWPLQSTVCRLELNKKSVRAWILHLLLAGDHHDEDDQDEVDRDEEDDEDDEDYDDGDNGDGDDNDGVDNENENDDDGDDDYNGDDCLCHRHCHHHYCLFTFSCFLYFNFAAYQQQDPLSLQTNIGPHQVLPQWIKKHQDVELTGSAGFDQILKVSLFATKVEFFQVGPGLFSCVVFDHQRSDFVGFCRFCLRPQCLLAEC